MYKEKPISVVIEGGQKVTEGFEYSVAIAGILSENDKQSLTSMAQKMEKAKVFAVTDDNVIVYGSGIVEQDKSSFAVKTSGFKGMVLGKSIEAPFGEKIYLPEGGSTIRIECTVSRTSQLLVAMLGKDGKELCKPELLEYTCPIWQGKMRSVRTLTLEPETSYILLEPQDDAEIKNPTLSIQ